MATNINGVFKIRRGTNAALASVVLLDGEIGYATDTKVMKVGDGVSTWSGLTIDDMYTKTEVQTIINNLITKINSLVVPGLGNAPVSDIDNSGLW